MIQYGEILIDVVSDLNQDFYEKSHDDEMFPFEYSGNGPVVIIDFMGQRVWNTEDDSFWDENDKEMNADEIKKIILYRAKEIARKTFEAI